MDLFLAISQAVGVSLAVGSRPFLAALLFGVLARAGVGIDLEGSDFEFVGSTPFLAAMLVGVALLTVIERPPRQLPFAAAAGTALVLGAGAGAASLSGDGEAWAVGLPLGAAAALIGLLSARAFIGGAIARLAGAQERPSAVMLVALGDVAALTTVAACVLLPPVAYPVLAFCIWILLSARRRASGKYEGLRVLR